MSVRELIDRVRGAFVPPVRDASCDEAIQAANSARNTARAAAELIELRDPKSARELRIAADRISATATRMWSL